MTTDYAKVEAELNARGVSRADFDVSRVEALLELLGSPQRAYPTILVTGTNGKTSTARMVDALLRAHGLRTGRYTTPHLTSVRERISIDGEPVGERAFVDIHTEVAPAVAFLDQQGAAESLTSVDLLTAMALAAFADAPVEVAVIEVGWDPGDDVTPTLQPVTCVFMPIGAEPGDASGETLEEAALARSEIIHSGATVICALQPVEVMAPILERCAETGATIAREGAQFGVVHREVAVGGQLLTLQGLGGRYDEVFLPLHGAHQAQNAAVALATVEAFLGAGAGVGVGVGAGAGAGAGAAGPDGRPLDPEVVRAGFADVSAPGRLERVRTAPTMLLDAAHNVAALTATIQALRDEFPFERLIVVLAVLSDQDALGLLEVLEPVTDSVVCTRNTSSSALPAERLADLAESVFDPDRVYVEPFLPDAIEAAVALVESDVEGGYAGVGVLITGSAATVADARALLVTR